MILKQKVLFLGLLMTCFFSFGQYPFDKFEKPVFETYDDWKIYELTEQDKIHQTITILDFYPDNSSLTLQLTIEDFLSDQSKSIFRIYKDQNTLQVFRNCPVDLMPNYTNFYPLKVVDLNGDGLKDIKLLYDYHSQGLHLSYRPFYFIQQPDHTFIIYSFDNMFEDRMDLERDLNADGVFEIISVQLVGKENYNYWQFSILNFEPAEITDQSEIYDFPIYIQFLNRRNYTPTSIKFDLAEYDPIKDLHPNVDSGIKMQ